MRKIVDCSDTPVGCSLRDSLDMIKEAHVQLDVLTGMSTTATVLASQIELCDVLLIEISGIRSTLARDLQHTRGRSQHWRGQMA
jgi:hypothetical protein